MKVSAVLTTLFLVATSDLVANAAPVPAPEPGTLVARQCRWYKNRHGHWRQWCNNKPSCHYDEYGNKSCVLKREAEPEPEPEPAPLQKRSAEPEPAPEPAPEPGTLVARQCKWYKDRHGHWRQWCNDKPSCHYDSHGRKYCVLKRAAEPEPLHKREAEPAPAPEPGTLVARQCYWYKNKWGHWRKKCNNTPTCHTDKYGNKSCVLKREAAPEPEPE